jgi:2-oxo-4-hydroxy-4-carboxy--5-ureidoimidazoline (OHCU) decarboxylase
VQSTAFPSSSPSATTPRPLLQAFQTRIGNDTATEFATACAQVERIAELRLKDQLP